MSKRHAREHGRILSVDEETLGSVLVADAASGATTLTVDDAAEFEDDGTGGWLSVNDQVIEYDTVDDDAGTIHLKTALTAAADDGDPVYVWSKLYDTAATVKTALVMVDGEDENTDPVHATLADAVQDLPEGLRGEAGEACTLVRVSDDDWEVTAVGGRPSSSKGAASIRFEANDNYVLTSDDITAGVATAPLSHQPIDESLVAFWRRTPQRPSEYTVNYDAKTVTWPLSGFEKAGDRLWFHYAYRKNIKTSSGGVDWTATGWRYLVTTEADTVDRSASGFDDSTWAVGAAPFANGAVHPPDSPGTWWPAPGTVTGKDIGIWLRRNVSISSGSARVSFRLDGSGYVYWNGALVASNTTDGVKLVGPIIIPAGSIQADNVLAVHAVDDVVDPVGDYFYIDVMVEEV